MHGLVESADLSRAAQSTDDGLFLAGIQQAWQTRRLELPVLPAAAIRLTGVLRAGDTPIPPLVELIESDASLSVEVLKSANRADVPGPPVRSIHDAIVRIGLRRLGAVLLMAQVTTKILKGSAVQSKASLLMEMAPPLAYVAGLLAKSDDSEDSLSFIRSTLLHVEHMVILGAVGEVSRMLQEPIVPSVPALLTAFRHFGPPIRKAVASSWNLEAILLARPKVAEEYAGFRKAIVYRWLGQPLPSLRGIPVARLEVLMTQIHPRVS